MPLSTGGEDRSHGADDQRTGGASWDTLQLHDWELWTRKDLCSNQLALWGLQIISWATPLKGVMVSYTGKQRQRPTTTLGVADTADSQGFYRWQTGCVHCQRKSVRNELKFTSITEKKQKPKKNLKQKHPWPGKMFLYSARVWATLQKKKGVCSRTRNQQVSLTDNHASYHHRVIKSPAAWKLVWYARDSLLLKSSICLSQGLNLIRNMEIHGNAPVYQPSKNIPRWNRQQAI